MLHTDLRWQDLRLNLMFTIATVVTNVSALPIGFLLDRVGPRRTSILGGVLFALGCFCFGLDMRIPGMFATLVQGSIGELTIFYRLRFLPSGIRSHRHRFSPHLPPFLPPLRRLPAQLRLDPIPNNRLLRRLLSPHGSLPRDLLRFAGMA